MLLVSPILDHYFFGRLPFSPSFAQAVCEAIGGPIRICSDAQFDVLFFSFILRPAVCGHLCEWINVSRPEHTPIRRRICCCIRCIRDCSIQFLYIEAFRRQGTTKTVRPFVACGYAFFFSFFFNSLYPLVHLD